MSKSYPVLNVCRTCFLRNSGAAEELCYEHDGGRCDVMWDESRQCFREYQIRPVPERQIKGRFIICSFDGRCRGERCSYAHSDAEQKEWNAKLSGESLQQCLLHSLPSALQHKDV